MPRAIDLSIIKVALEDASFRDYRIRDSLSKLIDELQLDLEEVAFDPAEQTKKAFIALEDTITEVETARSPKPPRFEMKDEELEVTRIHNEDGDDSVQTIRPEEIEEDSRPTRIVNVDDDLDADNA